MPWSKPEKDPCRDDKEQCEGHHAPFGIVNHPVEDVNKDGFLRRKVGIRKVFQTGDTKHSCDDEIEYRHYEKHVHGRVTHSATTVKVVADKVSRT